MAEKRMFTMKIIDSDAFLDMPLSTQALYFHLNMRADDDGFINNPKRVQRMIGASDDDLKLLIAKRFVICFESGVIVIKHWRMHNTLRKDRYNPTPYQDELATLDIKENNSYTEKPDEQLKIEDGNHLATNGIPNGNHLATQYSVVECSEDKYSIGECRESSNQTEQPPQTSTESIPMTDNEYNALVRKYGKSFVDSKIERAKQYTNTYNYTTISKWCEEDFKKQHTPDANRFNNYQQRPKQSDDYYNSLLANNARN